MPVLIDKTGPIANRWIALADAQAIGEYGHVLLPLHRWWDEREQWLNTENALGVVLEPQLDVARLRPDLDSLKLIAIQFGVFSDGRGFSQSRLLRDRYGYQNDIRAIGAVLRDQLAFMARCGITQFDVENEDDAMAALKAFAEFSVAYQPDMAVGYV